MPTCSPCPARNILKTAFPKGSDTAFVATAWNFPDALAASAAAGSFGAPVVLVDGKGTGVDAKSKALLTTLKVKTTKVAGGTGVVSPKVENEAPLYTVYANCVPRLVFDEIKLLGATKVVLLGGTGVLSANVAKLTACK